MDHFVAQMYACGLIEAKLLDDWEDKFDKSWRETQPHFTRKFNKERCKQEREKTQKNDESSAVFCKAPHPHTLYTPQEGANSTTADNRFTSEMEYATVLEEKANTQAERIIELEARVYDQTVLTKTTDYAASAVATGTNMELNEIRETLNQLADSVTPQAATFHQYERRQ